MPRPVHTSISHRLLLLADDAASLTVREVTRETWADFERLFESRGGPKNCWCMVWRGSPDERRSKQSRRRALERRVRAGVPVGLLAYEADEPVAWCSVAPRSTLRPLGGPDPGGPEERGDGEEDEDRVWALVCFFVTRRVRGRGTMRMLMEAAADHARARGATVLEASPVDPDSPSYRFMGFVPVFQEMGFREVGMAGKRRHVMRLDL
jgi:GNAT superfamily N-acetyltransferase